MLQARRRVNHTILDILLSLVAYCCFVLSPVEGQSTYACPPGTKGWPCLRNEDGSPLTIRVMFMDGDYVTTNPTARAKVASMGRTYVSGTTCDRATSAVPECFVFENWNGGWIGSFMNQALKDMGVNVVALTTANFSKAALSAPTSSSFTRCVWDVKYGNVDLCIGDFWSTPERRNLTAFTTAIDSDSFNLYTTRNASAIPPPFNPQQFLAIFTPFDNSVWMLCVLTMFFCTVALRIVERQPDDAPPRKFTPPKSAGDVYDIVCDLTQGMYDMVMSFLGGEDAVLDSARSWPSRFISLGIGLFVFVHVNSYTGSLAAYYVSNNGVQLGNVTGLQDIAAQGGYLCVYASMAAATAPIIASALPATRLVAMDRYGTMLEKLYTGNCSAAVVGKFESLTYVGASNTNFTVCKDPKDPNNFRNCANSSYPSTPFRLNPLTCGDRCDYARRYCGLIPIQDDLISSITLAWELPVSSALQPWVSYAMLRIHTAGNLSRYQAREILDINPVVCTPPPPPSNSIGLAGLAGTFVFCGGAVFIALALHFTGVAAFILSGGPRRRAAGAGAASATGADGDAGHAELAFHLNGVAAARAVAKAAALPSLPERPLAEALAEIERLLRKAKAS